MRKLLPVYITLLLFIFIIAQNVSAENIHFNDYVYTLKSTDISKHSEVIKNEYFTQNESKDFWTTSIDIYYYPEEKNPLKFAANFDKEIEKQENMLLLKFIQNKKQDIAVISYFENIIQNYTTYFIYNICKYEKHPEKGTLVLKFAKKYVFNTKEEITKIARDIKAVNNDYMEQMIILQIPEIVEKEIP